MFNLSKEEIQKKIASHALTAARIYSDKRIIPIVTYEKEKLLEIGSGVCLKLNDQYYIATAGHIVNNFQIAKRELRLVGQGENPQLITEFLEVNLIDDDISGVDIGYIKLTESEFNKLNKEYITIDSILINTAHRDNDLTLINGYPRDIMKHNKKQGGNIYTVKSMQFITYTLNQNHWEEKFKSNPNTNIVVKYPSAGIDNSENMSNLPRAFGMSGGGFWTHNARITGIWSANKAKLFGIINGWDSQNDYIWGTQIQHMLDLLTE